MNHKKIKLLWSTRQTRYVVDLETYISVELGERMDHIKPMHVHDRSVDDQLGAVGEVKA